VAGADAPVKGFRIGVRMVFAIVVLALVAAALWMTQPFVRARPPETVLAADPGRLARDVRMLAEVFSRDLRTPRIPGRRDHEGEPAPLGPGPEQGYIAAGRLVREDLALAPDTPERSGAYYDA
jgi:hypothetical protein